MNEAMWKYVVEQLIHYAINDFENSKISNIFGEEIGQSFYCI